MLSEAMTLSVTVKLISIALAIQTFELFQITKSFSDSGIWTWRILKNDFLIFPVWTQRIFAVLLRPANFSILLGVRLLSSLLILVHPHWALFALLLFTSILISIRWRGAFNGGSDAMTAVLLLSLFVGFLSSENPTMVKASLWFIAIQSTLSYFLAGIAKLKNLEWRKGQALKLFLKESHVPFFQSTLLSGLIGAWIVILFECAFPMIFLNPRLIIPFLFAGALFHFANIFIFGLNRFFWIWIATYPALYFCSSTLHF